MGKYDDKIKLLFGEYGTLEKMGDDSSPAYFFACDSKKIFDKENLLYYMGMINLMLVIRSSGECIIYCFRIGSNSEINGQALKIINEVNNSLEYGKYILDSDGDVDWEYIIDLDCVSQNDVYEILIVFMQSILNFGVIVNKIKLERKNQDKNGES